MGNLKKIKNYLIKEDESAEKPILLDLYFKESQKPADVIVFAHGFKGFKDWGHFELMAEYLANNGFIFIKFNFSHNGTTPQAPDEFNDLEAFAENTFSKELSDINQVTKWIAKGNEIIGAENIRNLFLIGHSRGGFISVLHAFDAPEVSALITLAAVADFENRYTNQQLEKWKKNGVMYIENSRTGQKMPLNFSLYEDLILNKEKLDIKKKASELNKPWLILHGNEDTSVESSHAYKFKDWNSKAELCIIEGANHVFGGTHPWNAPILPEKMKIACDKILDFLKF